MKRTILFVVLALILAVTPLRAGESAAYQTGKLIDLHREGTGAGAARAQGTFCLAVEVGDMTYLVSHVVGDPVEVKIKSKDLYLKRPKGGDLKTYITRRERNAPDKKPLTCALPIQSQQ
jgi:hypothetical protein